MKAIAILTEHSAVDRISDCLKLTLIAERPRPPQMALQKLLMTAETPAEYFS